MITIVTTRGQSVHWPDEEIKRISIAIDMKKSRPTSVFGPAKADIKTKEAPDDLINRLDETARKGIAKLTRLDESFIWLMAPKIADLRASRPGETAKNQGMTIIESGGVRTAVKETVEEARAILQKHGLKDGL